MNDDLTLEQAEKHLADLMTQQRSYQEAQMEQSDIESEIIAINHAINETAQHIANLGVKRQGLAEQRNKIKLPPEIPIERIHAAELMVKNLRA